MRDGIGRGGAVQAGHRLRILAQQTYHDGLRIIWKREESYMNEVKASLRVSVLGQISANPVLPLLDLVGLHN